MLKTKKNRGLFLKAASTFTIFNLIFAQALVVGLFIFTNTALAADTGWKAPTVSDGADFTNPDNAFSSDNVYTTVSTDKISQKYRDLGFNIPEGAVISGIEVRIEANHSGGSGSNHGGHFHVALSWNGGSNFTTANRNTADFGHSDSTDSVGGSSDTWGKSGGWSASHFSDANFRVRLTSDVSGEATLNLDYLEVKVYYSSIITASAGAGGTISPSGSVSVNYNANQTFTITPNTSYIVSDVFVDSVSQGRLNSYTFNNVTTDHTIAASFEGGWKEPSNNVNSEWSHPERAYTSNNSMTSANSKDDVVQYYNFHIPAIPAGATINGITVALEGYTTSLRQAEISLSWNGGANYTSGIGTGIKTTDIPVGSDNEATRIFGGDTDTWNRTWTANNFTDDNFRVKLDATSVGSGPILYIDQLQVKIYYTLAPTTTTLTLVKEIVNDNGGTALSTDWTLITSGATPISGISGSEAVTNATVNPGSYDLSESGGPPGYSSSAWVCIGTGTQDDDDTITLAAGQSATCTITNDDIAPKLTVTKIVNNNDRGTLDVQDFPLFVNGIPVNSGEQITLDAGNYTVSETQQSGYIGTISGNCASDGSITLNPGDVKECTITNDYIAPGLTVIKIVTNNNGGTLGVENFTLYINEMRVESRQPNELSAGSYVVSEDFVPGYAATISEDCDADGNVTLDDGETKVCIITNDDIAPSLTLVKEVVNNNSGTSTATDWTLTASGPTPISGEGSATSNGEFSAGTYTLSESGPLGYTASEWVCVGGAQENNQITIGLGERATCTITNDDNPQSGEEGGEGGGGSGNVGGVGGEEENRAGGSRAGGTVLPLTISEESVISAVYGVNIIINWSTTNLGTSQVIYSAEGQPHILDLNDTADIPAKYGYANTTPEINTNPKVTNHMVVITGLEPNTTYYFRTVSRGSFDISEEYSFITGPIFTVQQTTTGGETTGGGVIEEEIITEETLLEEGTGIETGIETGGEIAEEAILPAPETPTAQANILGALRENNFVAAIGLLTDRIFSSGLGRFLSILLLAILLLVLGREVYKRLKRIK